MIPRLSTYRSLVFDCDGVILNSNQIKTDAFRSAVLPWGTSAADELVGYHVTNGGISRYRKFEYFLDIIAPKYIHHGVPTGVLPTISELLITYSDTVKKSLLTCDVAEGLHRLRVATAHSKWHIVSGGDQNELRQLFARRGLDILFDGGIFGSPDNKDEILSRELSLGNIQIPSLFLGDSRYDCEASKRAGLDFLLLGGWSEMANWRRFAEENGAYSASNIDEILPYA